ncbi:MAG: helix-turn-helix transcriptional regulator [Treponema sp.]|jgi:DNA-binding Xre family transcriptional regulator|nr:helix-turn-helix transcriptional regulator [Treponema sp.]
MFVDMLADRIYIGIVKEYFMGISYLPLFHLLLNQSKKKMDLVKDKIITGPTLAKLSKGQPVDGKVIIRICEYLNCQPGDIMEYMKDTPEGGDK